MSHENEWGAHAAAYLPKGASLIYMQAPVKQKEDFNLEDKFGLYALQGGVYLFTIRNGDAVTLARMEEFPARNIIHASTPQLFRASLKEVGGQRWGYINPKGQFVLPPIYDEAHEFQENGLAVAEVTKRSGMINSNGYFIIKPIYEYIHPFSEARATAITSRGFVVIDDNGKEITSKAYSYIGDYHEGRALAADNDENGNYSYGYLNKQGREVIPLMYESASDFQNGKALVKLHGKDYQLINQTGKVIVSYPYHFVGFYGDGLLSFKKEENGKYGYINENGKIVIQPAFTTALAFKNGRAVVNTAEDYQSLYGLIDRKGSFLLKPKYNEINMLGQNRVSIGKAIDPQKPYLGSKFALGDTDGHILTGFLFNSISEFKEGYASVHDDEYTFFINLQGMKAKNLPAVSGSGILEKEGPLFSANIDLRLFYLNNEGEIIWQQNTVIPLNQAISILEKKYKPNKDYLVYYPQVEGYDNKEIRKKVNTMLSSMAGVKPVSPADQLEYNYAGDFEVPFYKKNLVQIKLNGYNYPFGAAHGMPTEMYTHIDLKSGQNYELKDLFKKDANYVKVLSDIIGERIKKDPQYSYIFPDTYKGIAADQPFYITEKDLVIYFTPYEIAPYAAGFPKFFISYHSIKEIIDTEGQFWKSFH